DGDGRHQRTAGAAGSPGVPADRGALRRGRQLRPGGARRARRGEAVMRRFLAPMLIAPALLAGCATHHASQQTLADLHKVRPDLQEVTIEQGLDQAMEGYRRFLQETPETAMTPEAMRRLADLQLEKRSGICADGKPKGMAAPQSGQVPKDGRVAPKLAAETAGAASRESDKDFERRTTAESGLPPASDAGVSPAGLLPGGADP